MVAITRAGRREQRFDKLVDKIESQEAKTAAIMIGVDSGIVRNAYTRFTVAERWRTLGLTPTADGRIEGYNGAKSVTGLLRKSLPVNSSARLQVPITPIGPGFHPDQYAKRDVTDLIGTELDRFEYAIPSVAYYQGRYQPDAVFMLLNLQAAEYARVGEFRRLARVIQRMPLTQTSAKQIIALTKLAELLKESERPSEVDTPHNDGVFIYGAKQV